MGLLDSVMGAMNGTSGNSNTSPEGGGGLAGMLGTLAGNPQVMQAIMGLLSNDGGQGGLSGLVARFQQAGLGEQIQSWIGEGANLPVSGAQMQQALGTETMSGLARQMGTSEGAAADQLSQLLPDLVNRLTPSGEMPASGLGGNADLMGTLGGLLGKR